MKKEDFLQYVEGNGGKLVGYHAVPFPVYVVHLVYESYDSDPFFPIYRAILQYVEVDPKLEGFSYFARVIGLDYDLLKRCRSFLNEQGMLRLNNDTYVISDDARRKYIHTGSRSTVKVTGSFLVDGKNLELLPDIVYQNERKLRLWDDNISTHVPVDPELDSAPFEKLAKKLKSSKTLQLLGLEPDGENFKVLAVDKKFLLGAFCLYYVNSEGNIIKELMYKNEPISCEALGSAACNMIHMVQHDTEGWKFTANLGFNAGESREMAKIAISSQKEGWAGILMKRYSLPQDVVFKVLYPEDNGLPVIELTEYLYQKCENPSRIVEDCKQGYIELPVSPNGRVIFSVRHNLDRLVDFYTLIEEEKTKADGLGKGFAQTIRIEYPEWRAWMVRLGFLEELELIDCACFILN